MNHQTGRAFTITVLLVAGYCVGRIEWPQPVYAQSAEATAKDFVVVAGHASTSTRSPLQYYVVTADGKAAKVLLEGDPLRAPKAEFPSKIEVKHGLPSRVHLDHSGRISK